MGQCTIDCLEEFRCDPYRISNDTCMSARGKVNSEPGSINGQRAEKTSPVSVVHTVAMITAAPSDVVIDVEESPILNTVVGHNAHGYRRYCFFRSLLSVM